MGGRDLLGAWFSAAAPDNCAPGAGPMAVPRAALSATYYFLASLVWKASQQQERPPEPQQLKSRMPLG